MKLSDFKDEKGVEVVAKLLVPIFNIVNNDENEKARAGGTVAFVRAILLNNAKDVKDMFAILHDVDPEDYHCDGASVMDDTLEMITDPPLMALFGLQRQTPASSGSASTTGEAVEESKNLSDTAKQD